MRQVRFPFMGALPVLIMVLFLFTGGKEVFASTTYGQLKEAEGEKEQAEQQISDTQEDLDNLTTGRSQLQDSLDQLNKDLQQATSELHTIESLIDEKNVTLTELQDKLAQAKIDEVTQYEAMKARIKFMYEKGNTAYLNLFFTSDSFADFLNKSEYIEQLTAYDRAMLQDFVALQKQIAFDEQSVQDEANALKALQTEASEKQEEVHNMVEETSAGMLAYSDEIAAKEQELLEYEKRLAESENDIVALKAKYEEELALSREAALVGFNDLSSVSFAAGDIDLMAAIIECEAGGEPYVGKVAVGNVVMNRVRSPKFPNTVLEVLYQNRQFSPVGSGRFAVVLARGANATCYQAAQDAMNGSAPVGNCLFFRTPIPGLVGMNIGGHVFY
ncbi:MAG: cell wall hydrolase [Lachnospiraceae bacterium]|nr:cell wall hydrolase [Lachnospiraceae bacterium]